MAVIAQSLGWERPDVPAPEVQAVAQPADGDGDPSAFLQALGVASAMPAPQGARDASTPDQALQAFEQMFFGEVKDVRQL